MKTTRKKRKKEKRKRKRKQTRSLNVDLGRDVEGEAVLGTAFDGNTGGDKVEEGGLVETHGGGKGLEGDGLDDGSCGDSIDARQEVLECKGAGELKLCVSTSGRDGEEDDGRLSG
jgi:hypothetical protein